MEAFDWGKDSGELRDDDGTKLKAFQKLFGNAGCGSRDWHVLGAPKSQQKLKSVVTDYVFKLVDDEHDAIATA